jgi:hypothetical protein
MKGYKTIFFVLNLAFFSIPSVAEEIKVNWLDSSNSKTRVIARTLLASDEIPSQTTTLYSSIEIKIEEGVATETHRRVRYFPTYNDTHSNGNETIYWDKEVEQLELLEATVLLPNGKSQRLSENNIRVIDSDAYNTFTDQKEVVLPFSGLRDGSISILEYRLRFNLADLESRWSTFVYPVLFDPVQKFEITVLTDAATPLSFWHNAGELIECTEQESSFSCFGQDLPAYKSDKGVLWRDVLAQVIVAEKQTWSELIVDNLQAFSKSNNTSVEVRTTVDELTRGLTAIDEKIAAVHEFVARDIRYVSMSELGHRITPHASASVLKNRFGDCKDKSALMQGMLSLIGIDAVPILVATERTDLSRLEIPANGYFDHMVVCFVKDGKLYCLDATDTNTDWQTIPSWIQNRAAIGLDRSGRTLNLPRSPSRWLLRVDKTIKFDDLAGVAESEKRQFSKEYAALWRNGLSWRTEGQRQEWLIEDYQANVADSIEPTIRHHGVEGMGSTLEITSEAKFEPFMEPDELLRYVEYDTWVASELNDMTISTKHYDATVLGADIYSSIEFDFNDLWTITWYPAELRLKGKFGSLERSVSKTVKDKIEIKTHLKIPGQRVKSNQIEEFNTFLELLRDEVNLVFDGTVN